MKKTRSEELLQYQIVKDDFLASNISEMEAIKRIRGLWRLGLCDTKEIVDSWKEVTELRVQIIRKVLRFSAEDILSLHKCLWSYYDSRRIR